MSELKATRGPWDDASNYPEFSTVRIFAGTHYIATVGSPDDQKALTVANAHLIAAAPDLYAASEAIVAACERERPDIIGRDDEYIYDELGSAMSGAYVAARAALAKARWEA